MVPSIGALALALCAGVSGCSRQSGNQSQQNMQQPQSAEQRQQNTQQSQSAEQQQHAQPPQTTEQQHAQQQPQSTAPEQHAQQQPPQSAEQQQHARQQQSTEQQQHAQQQPQSTEQQPQNQNDNRQNAASGQNEIAAVTLNRGQIEQVQRALNQKGFNIGRVDGRMGPRTESALRSFQQQQKLEPSGQIDQQTLAALGLNDLARSTVGRGRGQQAPAPGRQGANP